MDGSFFTTGEFYSGACALLWAVAIILFRLSGQANISPVALNLFKGVVALSLLFVTLPLVGVPFFPEDRSAADWATLLVSGVIGIAIADTLFFASLNRLGAGRKAVVDCLYSPFVAVCAFLYLGEPMRPALLVAIALMVLAIFLGTWSPNDRDAQEIPKSTLRTGIALGAASMLGMALGIVLAKPVLDVSNPWWSTTVRLLGATVFLAVQGLLPRHRAAVRRAFRPGPHWRFTLPGALVGGYAAMVLWVMGLTYTRTSIAGVLNQLAVVFVLVLAAIFLHERLTARRVAAVAMGFAGAVLVTIWG